MTTAQRWVRPFDFPPGFWKRQLPGKILKIGAKGDIDALDRLLDEHPEYLSKRGSHNRTLLWEAVRAGKMPAVRWLAERGAEIDAVGAVNGECYVLITPYCAAVYYGRAEIAEFLRPRSAQPDIFRAAFLGDQSLVAGYLAGQPDLLDAEDPLDAIYYTPLLAFAVAGGQLAMAEDLLKRGAAAAPYSALLLHLAARGSRRDMVELLVGHGAEIPAVESGIFVDVSDMALFRYLLDHGAPVGRSGDNGFPPLVYAARGDKGEHPEKIRALLDYGAPVNAAGPKGRTALHYAASAGHLGVIAVLLEHGADPRARDADGETALSAAQAAGKVGAVELLRARG